MADIKVYCIKASCRFTSCRYNQAKIKAGDTIVRIEDCRDRSDCKKKYREKEKADR